MDGGMRIANIHASRSPSWVGATGTREVRKVGKVGFCTFCIGTVPRRLMIQELI